MALYFAYGSNLVIGRMRERLGACAHRGVGYVDGFALRFHKLGRDGTGKCDALRTRRAADRLYGVVYELHTSQIQALDRIEGPGYERISVPVAVDDAPASCAVYVARAAHIRENLEPFHWYRELVLRGSIHWGLPREHVRCILAVGWVQDPDQRRASMNLAQLADLGPGPARAAAATPEQASARRLLSGGCGGKTGD